MRTMIEKKPLQTVINHENNNIEVVIEYKYTVLDDDDSVIETFTKNKVSNVTSDEAIQLLGEKKALKLQECIDFAFQNALIVAKKVKN